MQRLQAPDPEALVFTRGHQPPPVRSEGDGHDVIRLGKRKGKSFVACPPQMNRRPCRAGTCDLMPEAANGATCMAAAGQPLTVAAKSHAVYMSTNADQTGCLAG